jgi:ketosteroid isomerase-like protein
MKICIFILCMALTAAACNNPKPKTIMPPVNNSAANKAIIEQYFVHFNNHNWKALADMYVENPEMKDPAFGTANINMSKADIVKKYTELNQMISDVRDSIVAMYPAGNNTVVEFVSTGTEPGGKKFALPICTIFEIKEGKITKDFTYYDNVEEK